ncbi:serine hydrolase [Aureisphaera galaxeae]|uniref:serine hydrolase domain-containing protein n=1 Tax=Aureisphaera galaxeae TaxID=1538023 RepID=UPI0023508317|nr:serine hydrolase domain-containing protein [Aureisphaera galaxeae]MDC8004350.1 serine hydrolase [Aureisphaera galaxeae]
MPTKLIPVLFVLLLSYACANKKKEDKVEESFHLTAERTARLDSLNVFFTQKANEDILPGFAVSIFSKDTVFLSKGYGFANMEKQLRYNPQTVQMIASVSKTLIGVALMKAVEEGKLSLDAPINEYLPYQVVHAHFPDSLITVRHLATHTSGINDEPNGGKGNIFAKPLLKENWREVWHPIIAKYNTNETRPMDEFLQDVFSEKGAWYDEDTFLNHAPGTHYEYSNYGSALLAHIIEIAAQTDYREYTRKHIIDPLQMKRSGWSKAEVDTLNHIAYYNDRYHALPEYSIVTYPDGGFYSTIEDMTLFLQEMMRGYDGEGKLLSAASYEEMFTVYNDSLDSRTGLIWDLDQGCCIGHGGNDFGIATMMFFFKEQGIGRILFSNLDVQQEQQDEAFYGIHNELYTFE